MAEDDATVLALPQSAVVRTAMRDSIAHLEHERAIALGGRRVSGSSKIILTYDPAHRPTTLSRLLGQDTLVEL